MTICVYSCVVLLSLCFLRKSYDHIARSAFLVADVTRSNPNVFYELGYGHALGKKAILLTQDIDEVPFDLKMWRHIVYNPNAQNSLAKRLRNTAINVLDELKKV